MLPLFIINGGGGGTCNAYPLFVAEFIAAWFFVVNAVAVVAVTFPLYLSCGTLNTLNV